MIEKNFFQIVTERRSIRNFKTTPIDDEIVKKIIDTCNLAPSAGGLQSFEIYEINNKETKDKIVKAAMDQEFIAQSPLLLAFCANPASSSKYGKKAKLFSIQDATIAASYAQLTASALGLASVWVGAFNEEKVCEILGLSEIIPVVLLPIGYKNEEPQIKMTRGREIFHKLE